MRIALLHLSDIHFRETNNPVLNRIKQLAAAANSEDPMIDLLLIIISGDITFSGKASEYESPAIMIASYRTLK